MTVRLSADGSGAEVLVRNRLPVGAAVDRFPHAGAGAAEVEDERPSPHSRDRGHSSAAATTDDQRVVHAPLREIARAARDAGIEGPATLVVGRVVDMLGRKPEPSGDVERRGFEPLTSAVRGQRSPS